LDKIVLEVTRNIVRSIDDIYVAGKDVKDSGWYIQIFGDV